jgi:ribulose kinase
VSEAAYSWTELGDYIPAVLAGVTKPREIMRGVCAAGHKAFYSEEWGGLPYRQLQDAFGGVSKCADVSGVMKELIYIKEEQQPH